MASRKVISFKGEITIPILGYVTEKNEGETIENAIKKWVIYLKLT